MVCRQSTIKRSYITCIENNRSHDRLTTTEICLNFSHLQKRRLFPANRTFQYKAGSPWALIFGIRARLW